MTRPLNYGTLEKFGRCDAHWEDDLAKARADGRRMAEKALANQAWTPRPLNSRFPDF